MREEISIPQLNELIRPLMELPLSRIWRGYGSALFLDLGELRPVHFKKPGKRPRLRGEANVHLYFDWRFETDAGIACGSSNSGPKIDAYITTLRKVQISALTVGGSPPELTLTFSDGQRLRSMAMLSGDPQWYIRLLDHSYISCEDGVLVHLSVDETVETLTSEEQDALALGDSTSARWNEPKVEPVGGECRDCRFFIHLDGSFALSDYGVCANGDSPFDGRVVYVTSGCPLFDRK